MVALVDQLARHDDPMVRAILGVNAGLDKEARGLWKYAGFKGGSEPGVIALVYLLESEDGRRYALVGGWNDPTKAVQDLAFVSLMGRLAKLAATEGR